MAGHTFVIPVLIVIKSKALSTYFRCLYISNVISFHALSNLLGKTTKLFSNFSLVNL